MNSISKYAGLGVLGFALTITPAAAAQANDSGNGPSAAGSMQSSDIVPGTGMTVAELRDLGYDQQQIAEMRNTDMSMSEQAGNTADRAGNEAREQGRDVQRAATDQGGRNWGWIGLFGLLGLLGLRGGKRHAAVDQDRNIRRVA